MACRGRSSTRHLAYSIGFGLTDSMATKIAVIPDDVWTPPTTPTGRSVTAPG